MTHVSEFAAKGKKIVGLLSDDLATIKTGRAKPGLVEHVKVEVYGGTWMEVRELASISAPDVKTIVINPWDKSIMKDLEVGLRKNEMNLNPVVDGEIIRISIASLTEETRREFVKLVYQKLESHKAMIRQERAGFKKVIEGEKNTSGVSEDDVKQSLEELQKEMDAAVSEMDELAKRKEDDLMTV